MLAVIIKVTEMAGSYISALGCQYGTRIIGAAVGAAVIPQVNAVYIRERSGWTAGPANQYIVITLIARATVTAVNKCIIKSIDILHLRAFKFTPTAVIADRLITRSTLA